MALVDDLDRIRGLVQAHVGDAGAVSGILAAEPFSGRRIYVCAIDGSDGLRSWVAVSDDGTPVSDRAELRAGVSIAAMCEIAADVAGGGDLDGVIASLAELREREAPDGIDSAEAAARALREVVGDPPQLATPARLDAIGDAARRLEQELGPNAPSPFVAAMKAGQAIVGELEREIVAGYLSPLE